MYSKCSPWNIQLGLNRFLKIFMCNVHMCTSLCNFFLYCLFLLLLCSHHTGSTSWSIIVLYFVLESCKADVSSCEKAINYNFSNITTLAGIENFQKHTVTQGENEGDRADFTHRTWLPYITLPFFATVLSASGWVRAHLGRCVFVCVLSPTDISSNVGDISRGFEGLIPSVFEELCAALHTTLRKALHQSQQHALPSGPYFWAACSHSPIVWSGEDLHHTLPAFSKWLVHCLVFYLVLLFSPERWSVSASLKWCRKAITKRYGRRKPIEMAWEGVRGRERKKVWEREWEICFSWYRLVSGAKWHRLTSLFHRDQVKKSLASLCPLLSLF